MFSQPQAGPASALLRAASPGSKPDQASKPGVAARSDVSHGFAVFVLILLSLASFLPGFTTLPPMDRDEPRFAQATKQMLETGDFVAIRFQDEARNKKPVGIYWLQAAAVAGGEALGLHDARRSIWLYRIPSLLGALATVLGTYWAGLALTTRRGALMAASLMAASVLLVVEAHLAKTDAVTAATVVFAMGALARCHRAGPPASGASREWRDAAVFWTAVGLGILVKGPITPMIPAFAAVALSLHGRSARWLLRLRPLPGLLWMALLALPWFVLILLRTHGVFLTDAVGHDMLGKVAGGQELHGAPPGTYLAVFWATAWPMAPFLLLATPHVWRSRATRPMLFLFAWAVPAWLLFEAVPTKLPHYVLPLYPALALAAGAALAEAGPLRRPRAAGLLLAVMVALMAAVIAITLDWGRPLLWNQLDSATLAWGCLAILGVIICGIAAGVLAARNRLNLAVPAALVAALISYGFVFGRLLSPAVSEQLDLSARLARAGREAAGPACREPIFASTGDHEPSLVFLTNTAIRLTSPADAASFMRLPGPCRVAFVTSTSDPDFLSALGRESQARLAGHVSGTFINGGKSLDIDVYVGQ